MWCLGFHFTGFEEVSDIQDTRSGTSVVPSMKDVMYIITKHLNFSNEKEQVQSWIGFSPTDLDWLKNSIYPGHDVEKWKAEHKVIAQYSVDHDEVGTYYIVQNY